MDPLLTDEVDRYSIFPIRHPDIWDMYKKQFACFWVAHEISLVKDLPEWEKLTDDERYFIEMILAFFASSDIIINENIEEFLESRLKILEGKFLYAYQKMMENIHSEMYARLIDTYIKDQARKEFLFNAIKNVEAVKQKAEWAKNCCKGDKTFAEMIVAQSIVEGIFFSGAFCAIFWLKERGILHGLTDSNKFIARDEGLHVDAAVLLHSKLLHKVSKEYLHDLVSSAVEVEIKFITESLPCKLIGMNADLMIKYIKYVANRLVKQYGYDDLYPGTEQPFPFMERILLKSKTNFFERDTTEYNKEQEKDINEDPYAEL